jgi:hypothetical protein
MSTTYSATGLGRRPHRRSASPAFFDRYCGDEPKFNEQTLQRSKLGRQPQDILPPSRTRLLEPADIWRDLKRR